MPIPLSHSSCFKLGWMNMAFPDQIASLALSPTPPGTETLLLSVQHHAGNNWSVGEHLEWSCWVCIIWKKKTPMCMPPTQPKAQSQRTHPSEISVNPQWILCILWAHHHICCSPDAGRGAPLIGRGFKPPGENIAGQIRNRMTETFCPLVIITIKMVLVNCSSVMQVALPKGAAGIGCECMLPLTDTDKVLVGWLHVLSTNRKPSI